MSLGPDGNEGTSGFRPDQSLSRALGGEQIVFDGSDPETEAIVRRERAKRYAAEQLALGPLGDPHVIAVKYRIPDAYLWEDGQLHYLDGRIADDQNPFNEQPIVLAETFSGPDEFTSLVISNRLDLTQEQREEIALESEAADGAKAAGPATQTIEQFQEENWRLFGRTPGEARENIARDNAEKAAKEKLDIGEAA